MESLAPAPPIRPSLAAGALAGLVGAVSFWAFHTLWIRDVPAVLVEGVVWGLGAGAAAGWAFHRLHERAILPADWRGGVMLALILWLLLLPYEVAGLAWGPFTHLTRPTELIAIAPVGFLGVPFAVLLGWALTRDRRATLALSVAAGLAHFMIGGSLVYFGGRGAMLTLFLWMLPTHVVAGLVLVGARAALLRRDARRGARHPPAHLGGPSPPTHPKKEVR